MIREIRTQRGDNEGPGECGKARAGSEIIRIDWSAEHLGTGRAIGMEKKKMKGNKSLNSNGSESTKNLQPNAQKRMRANEIS